ncbi:uncharacterized protein PGTG_00656 [Puccinia graminis f. sp. tritici CRL 75-36-700-3]|uniref:Transketolase-like pyrimidine-binding domain-containing protein n=1 Tax=Puccinia graminis f. sp. tritici (strain CRL 75-36-700-3 / race SCCL) TaxID=418459 RepID=E3JQR8_PUCGT|nr:uncharacterized protein PGTG_00656 [Puccinia graminis f. sp. tritici CRL 75-36-700-3]EFP74700.1 hypothetical protein PGTG_00656 [Puccinia graminis f. sp. tritici CRL 75-36-700-3]
MSADKFPIPFVEKFHKVALDPSQPKLSADQKSKLLENISILRDAIVFFTATGAARGVSGHTGGPFDTVPEVCLLLALFASDPDGKKFDHTFWDEAGHRVATQYLVAALEGHLPAEQLMMYREAQSKLPGHPELGLTPGVKFSSGRLGHMWPLVNGVAMANRGKTIFCLGSDGSQQEGNDAEAARLAVAQNLNVKLLIDDNDVTIAGHPSDYMKGYEVSKTLEGHGLKVFHAEGENIDSLWSGLCSVISHQGPAALIAKRLMCPGIQGLEGSNHGHDVIPVPKAIAYLKDRPYGEAAAKILNSLTPSSSPYLYIGCTKEKDACRVQFGKAVNMVLDKLSKEEAKEKVMVIDSDLEGSTGLKAIRESHPEVFIPSGIMERGNFSAAAGFGFEKGKVGVFSTFSAFLEMCCSEITMARLNRCNVLCHFSHSGVDEMCDNTCHFGLNTFFADNGLEDGYPTRLYFPADVHQMTAIVNEVFWDMGLRFVFSTRSKVPNILKEGSQEHYFGGDYKFKPGKDEFIRRGKIGTVICFGEIVHRALDAVDRLREEGFDVGLVNKSTLNVIDEEAIAEYGKQKFVLVVESLNQKTGLGSKMGTWLLERGLTPRYGYMGTNKEGCGGLSAQIFHQGLDPASIIRKVKVLAA